MIFQKMKQLKAQIKTKRWKPAKTNNLGWKTKQHQPVRQGFFIKMKPVKGTNQKQTDGKPAKTITLDGKPSNNQPVRP